MPQAVKAALYQAPLVPAGVGWLLRRSAPEGRVVVGVSGGICCGSRMKLHLSRDRFYWLGMHEIGVQRALERETRPGMTVYDIGAHLGFFSLGLARLVGPAGKVFAFEPMPENAQALRENVALNDSLAGRVRVVEAAVSEASGRQVFYGQVNSAQGRLGEPGARPGPSYEVETVSLDDFVFSRREAAPQLIKLDVEGAEGAALQGARRLLREARPVCLLEVHGEEAARAVWEVLREAQYEIKTLNGEPVFEAGGLAHHHHHHVVARGAG